MLNFLCQLFVFISFGELPKETSVFFHFSVEKKTNDQFRFFCSLFQWSFDSELRPSRLSTFTTTLVVYSIIVTHYYSIIIVFFLNFELVLFFRSNVGTFVSTFRFFYHFVKTDSDTEESHKTIFMML